jgi:2-succinyl-5-enolpyruvyl-6-hydroxy-3-cyclohexene-1-carboxylate synthase
MSDVNLNALWGRCIAEELELAGCRHVVGCPGSRNSPLLFALAAVFGERLAMHLDERGAAFYALGLAKALRAPVAVCVTSGTAAANLLPAACEADAAGVPLILLTADRPWEQQGCGAPQTMAQRGLFGVFADTVEIGEPVAEDAVLHQLRARIAYAVGSAQRPLHINVPLRDPLPPIPGAWVCPPLSDRAPGPPSTSSARIRAELVLGAPRKGLIVAGPAEVVAPALVARLAEATGFPVLADACSGLRRPAVPHLAACPDALYARPPGEPEVIIRIGPPPLTRAGYEWLGRQRCPQIVLGGPRNDDFLASATARISDPDEAAIEALVTALGRADPAWTSRWMNLLPTTTGWNATAASAAVCAADAFPLLWLASSMAIRDANLVLAPRCVPQRVLCNRGLNGIDGTIASFLGACWGGGSRGLCLIGDLALLHDLNSLALAAGARGAMVVLNNGGGAIFDALPVAQVPGYRRLVRTDHDLDFSHAAAQFRLPYRRCADQPSLVAALAEATTADVLMLIECDLRGSDGIAAHRAALAS